MTGARAREQQVDALANNLANAKTAGFKGQRTVWQQIYADHSKMGDPNQSMAVHHPVRVLPIDRLPNQTVDQYTQWAQGPLEKTDNPLSVALEGEGFFMVEGPEGRPLYTRDGAFTRDAEGRLVTQSGRPVLDPNGQPITLGQGQDLFISVEGFIEDDQDVIGQLGVVRFDDPATLQRVGDNLWAPPEGGAAPQPAEETSVRQGMVEGSNISVVQTMVGLIKANRLFEMSIRAVQTYREIDQQAARDVGRLT